METIAKTKQNKKQPGFGLQNEIVINRVFDLAVSKMWQAWTEPEYFKKWWGPDNFICSFSEMEARVGGKYLNRMQGPFGKEFSSTGVVKEFVPEKKLVVSDHFSDEKGNTKPASGYGTPGELLITVTMQEADGSTRLRLRHEGIPDEMRYECIRNWNESLDKLQKNIR